MRFISYLFLASWFALAGPANAVPIQWTIPAGTYSGSGNNLTGSFVYDSDTNIASNIDLIQTNNSLSSRLTVAAMNDGEYLRFVVTNSVGQQGAYLSSIVLTNSAGIVTIPANMNMIGIGKCSNLTNGLCDNIVPFGRNITPLTIIGAPYTTSSNSIPTLSEWAQIAMMLLMLITAGCYGRRMKQR